MKNSLVWFPLIKAPYPYFKPLISRGGGRVPYVRPTGKGVCAPGWRPARHSNVQGTKVRTSDPAYRRWKVVGCPHANHAPGGKTKVGKNLFLVTMLLGWNSLPSFLGKTNIPSENPQKLGGYRISAINSSIEKPSMASSAIAPLPQSIYERNSDRWFTWQNLGPKRYKVKHLVKVTFKALQSATQKGQKVESPLVRLLMLQKSQGPTTLDVQNLVNNGISTTNLNLLWTPDFQNHQHDQLVPRILNQQ